MELTVTVDDLLGLTLLIALGFLLAVAFYESLARRDVLVARVQRLAGRVSRRWWVSGLAYLAAVAVGIPLLIVVWTLVLEATLFFVGSVDLLESVAIVAVAVVGATRILAYVHHPTAHELSKTIPLALLLLLLTGEDFDLDNKIDALAEREAGEVSGGMLAFLIVLELVMRIATDGSHALLRELRRRQGIESDLGVWRTLWGAVRSRSPVEGATTSAEEETDEEVRPA